jgi:hypothetical protein
MQWLDDPPTLGEPHHGFFYPDPLGFWSEVRRWIGIIVRTRAPAMSAMESLAVASLVHCGEDPSRVAWATDRCRPVVTLLLDEASREAVGIPPPADLYTIPDPHRKGTSYEGWWTTDGDDRIIGKAPQHPASHNFYQSADMDRFLGALPMATIID